MKGLTWTNGKGRQVGDGGASQYKPVEGRKAEGRIQTAQQGRVQEGTGKARKCKQSAGLEVRPWRKAVAGQGWGMGMQGMQSNGGSAGQVKETAGVPGQGK